MEDLIYASAAELARAVREKKASSVEIVQAYIERIEAVNPQLNAVVQLTADSALTEARRADEVRARDERIGPLHGVPMTIKDSWETAGVITTAGTKGLETNVPKRDTTIVARLKAAGAIMLGKTNTPEITLQFATDNFVYGRTNNPYDVERTPGGSSGGAAAIVAAGGSPFDIGSDTGGSIRLPAHFCGIAGLKPTAGRVPRTGHIPGLEFGAVEAFTQVGPLARYGEDLHLILSIISGVDWRDPAAIPMPLLHPETVDRQKLRIAYYLDNGITSASTETVSTVQSAVAALVDSGAIVAEDRPPHVETSAEFWRALFLADGGAGVSDLLQVLGTKKRHPLLDWTQAREALPGPDYNRLLARWNSLRSDCLAFLENYDVVLCPANATPAHRHKESTPCDYTFLYNLLGWPVAVVRCGTSPDGLPIGVQVAARPWREDIVLAVVQYLERVFGGWQRPAI